METISQSFKPLPKRDPQRYIMRHIETELKQLQSLINAGKNSIAWLLVQDTAEAKELSYHIEQRQQHYIKLLNIALERYEKLISNQVTNDSAKYDTFKSKVKVTKQDL